MPVFQLSSKILFPDPDFAEPDGLLAVGGDLSPERLIKSYTQGIFPWYSQGEPLLWWSPAPRLILLPEEFHLPKSLARTIRRELFRITTDTAFSQVIEQCAETRTRSGEGTWITTEMKEAYCRLHELGYAHSIESWQNNTLAGGLYGICLDRVFFGESMFSKVSDASKVALAFLVSLCKEKGIRLIDCQMTTKHLLRFGAKEVSREEFRQQLTALVRDKDNNKNCWTIQ
jgi:leucyl/phenylalanyl-tRNA--protein transferase